MTLRDPIGDDQQYETRYKLERNPSKYCWQACVRPCLRVQTSGVTCSLISANAQELNPSFISLAVQRLRGTSAEK